MKLPVVFALLQVHITLGCDVVAGHNIVDKFVLIVYRGMYAELNVLVEPNLWLVKMLADIQNLS